MLWRSAEQTSAFASFLALASTLDVLIPRQGAKDALLSMSVYFSRTNLKVSWVVCRSSLCHYGDGYKAFLGDTLMRYLIAAFCAGFIFASHAHADTTTLRLATWNLEHLVETTGTGCAGRTDDDVGLLKDHVSQVEADIIAFQEVENLEAARKVFPPEMWQLVISERPDAEPTGCRRMQRTGFAVRNGIAFSHARDLDALGSVYADKHARWGTHIVVTGVALGEGNDRRLRPIAPVHLLSVHLKSGCPAFGDREQCEKNKGQFDVVEAWAEQRHAEGVPFFVLGDFNARITSPEEPRWVEFNDGEPRGFSMWTVTMKGQATCNPKYKKRVDHVITNRPHQYWVKPKSNSYTEWPFKTLRSDNKLPSDHCPVSVDVEIPLTSKYLTNGLYWLRHSGEYEAIAEQTYSDAADAFDTLIEVGDFLGKTPVVSMDLDETVLDNSLFEVEREWAGVGYKTDLWKSWSERQAASAVPGALLFLEHVFKTPKAHIAFVTNRLTGEQSDTIANLRRLIKAYGAAAEDYDADAVLNGLEERTCNAFKTDDSKKNERWAAIQADDQLCGVNSKIVLWIGDNVQDLAGITQKERETNLPTTSVSTTFFVLPNPNYGSWNDRRRKD